MKPTEQTTQQIERFINKIAQKFPESEDPSLLTDIHIIVSQDSGEMLAFDDDETEITRCVVEQWIDNKDDDFYDQITNILRSTLHDNSKIVDKFGILKPYSFVLENDDNENIAELYLADDETVILGGDLMEGLNKDLDDFLDNLIK
jgi:hypothetical protein